MAYEVQMQDAAAARTLDVARVVELERAIAADGTPLSELMDRAGASVAAFVEGRWRPGSKVAVLCGTGNNGGDGWVAAGLLAKAGYLVRVVTPCTPAGISAHPAREAAEGCMERVHGMDTLGLSVLPDAGSLDAIVSGADVVVDAMLGTGFHHASLHEPTAGWVAAIARAREAAPGARPFVVAVDVPSGLNAQTGDATDPAVAADATITMMAVKPGLSTPRGRGLAGELHVARIADIEKYL